MADAKQTIPETTLETLARNFYKQSHSYGFQQEDYIRFVNVLLDYAMNHNEGSHNNLTSSEKPITNLSHKDMNVNFEQLPLCSSRLRIRAFNRKLDSTVIEEWLNDDYGRYFLLSRTTAHELNLEQLIQNKYNILGVVTLPDETPIGVVAFLDHDPIQKKAELRKLIGLPSMRGKGLAKEATRLWIHYGKAGLGLQKIYLNTLNTYIRNIRLNEDLGFKVEGILRNETLIDGKYYDVLRMGMWNGILKHHNP